jgi:hypothetical protein
MVVSWLTTRRRCRAEAVRISAPFRNPHRLPGVYFPATPVMQVQPVFSAHPRQQYPLPSFS